MTWKKIFALILVIATVLGTLSAISFTASAATKINSSWATVWNGTASEKPSGSGTKNDPYLIAHGKHLKWLSDSAGVPGAHDGYMSVALNGAGTQTVSPSEPYTDDYIYCKQVADIDLGGKSLQPIGAYISLNMDGKTLTHTQYFYGEYDGQGYTIKNGTFTQTANKSTNKNWPVGMFGVLWGATVKNLTFDNIVASGNSVVGIVAGHSYGKFGEAVRPERQNVISNITVTDTCKVNLWTGAAATASDTKNFDNGGIGGLVGRAYNTHIEDCDVSANIDVDYGHTKVGGIVGYMSNATLVDGCTFSGVIDYTAALLTQTQIGGIVGQWQGNGNLFQGTSGIIDCVNFGSFVDGVSGSAVLGLGGILGGADDIKTGPDGSNVNLFENNYNLSDTATFGTSYGKTRLGGVIGYTWTAEVSSAYEVLEIVNCHTVGYNGKVIDTTYDGGIVIGMNKKRNGVLCATETNCTNGEYDADTLNTIVTAMLDCDRVITMSAGWDGKTAIVPKGQGTAQSPYLIASAANLKWLSDCVGNSGDVELSTVAPNHKGEQTVAKLSDTVPVYCKQTADIDLNGKNIKTIGSYVRWDRSGMITDNAMQYFCGEYDGQGYTIKNGSFTSQSTNNNNIRWTGGMFGSLYGATVKNLTFDNMTVKANSVAGMVAGYGIAIYSEAQDLKHKNVIKNIIVTDTCRITSADATIKPDAASAFGGIIGHAHNTDISNCSVAGSVVPLNQVQFVGGVAGVIGQGTVVDRCIFKGSIVYNNKISRETVIGGIVGDISSFNELVYSKTGITNCVNDGYFVGKVVNDGTSAFCMGGILGGICGAGAAPLRGKTPFICDSNYNLSSPAKWNYNGVDSNGRVGGILGGAWNNDNSANSSTYVTFPITNCHTVPYPSVNADYSASIYESGIVTGAIRKRENLSVVTESNCTQDATLGSNSAVIGLARSISSEHAFLGAQYKDNGNGTYSIRFISGIKSLDYVRLVYTVGINNGTKTVCRNMEQTKVYTSFSAIDGEKTIVVNAKDYGFEYLSIVTFTGLKEGSAYSFSFKPTAVKEENGVEIAVGGESYSITFDSRKSTPVFATYAKPMYMSPMMINGNGIGKYNIVYKAGDPVSYYTAQALKDYIKSSTGIELSVVDTVSSSSEYEIRIDHSKTGNTVEEESYKICVAGNSLELLYGDNASAAILMMEALKNLYMNVSDYKVNLRQSGSDIIVFDGDMSTPKVVLPQNVSAKLVEKDEESDIRVLYQNIWGLSETAQRMDALLNVRKAVYLGYAPDVICLQEASATSHKTCGIIQWLLDNGYSMYRGKSRIAAGTKISCVKDSGGYTCPANQAEGVAIPIFYKADRFTLSDSGYEKSVYTGDKGTSWVLLADKITGEQFAVFNSHFSANSNAENKAKVYDFNGNGTKGDNSDAYIMGEMMRYYEAQRLMALVNTVKGRYSVPIFAGGDYNTSPNNAIKGAAKASVGYNDEYVSFNAGDVIRPYYVFASVAENNNGNGTLTQVRNGISAELSTPYSPSGGAPVFDEALGFFNIASFAHTDVNNTIDYAMYDFSDGNATILRYYVCHDIYSSTSSDHKPHFVDFRLK